MKLDKTFSIIGRINQALLLIGLLGIFGLATWGLTDIYKESHELGAGEIAVTDKKVTGANKKILSFGSFHKTRGRKPNGYCKITAVDEIKKVIG